MNVCVFVSRDVLLPQCDMCTAGNVLYCHSAICVLLVMCYTATVRYVYCW